MLLPNGATQHVVLHFRPEVIRLSLLFTLLPEPQYACPKRGEQRRPEDGESKPVVVWEGHYVCEIFYNLKWFPQGRSISNGLRCDANGMSVGLEPQLILTFIEIKSEYNYSNQSLYR